MVKRIIWALLFGAGFLLLVMQSVPWVLFIIALVHFAAQLEYAALIPGVTRLGRWCHAAVATVLLVLTSLVLVGSAAGRLVPVMLVLMMVGYSVLMLMKYEQGTSHRLYIQLLRSVLFVTLPLSFIPVIALVNDPWPALLLVMGASWGADTGAIFAGKLMGRTKLAPNVSPKKTVEGAVGGMFSAGACWLGTGLLWPEGLQSLWMLPDGQPVWILCVLMFTAGALVSILGMVGDLTFSLFKREAQRKDYSGVMPGHGGMLDRFDSFVFVAPVVYVLFCI